jgi:hypothetical protein
MKIDALNKDDRYDFKANSGHRNTILNSRRKTDSVFDANIEINKTDIGVYKPSKPKKPSNHYIIIIYDCFYFLKRLLFKYTIASHQYEIDTIYRYNDLEDEENFKTSLTYTFFSSTSSC